MSGLERSDKNIQPHRTFYANLITALPGTPNSRLTAAFAATPRERYIGPGPWRVFTGAGYINTPNDDPTLLYQDVTVAILEEKNINNGQPRLHAAALAALHPQEGETALHIGAGTGYYTAVLAHLIGPSGKLCAYEIEAALAERAAANLSHLPNVTVFARSGAEGPLPNCNVIYVNAGATAPLSVWLDALLPGGRLLFPLTPDGPNGTPGGGGMLLITRTSGDTFDARFLMPVLFIPCLGARDDETAKKLAEAFKRGDMGKVRSLRRHTPPDETCWCSGNGWWLSTAASK